MSIIDLLLNNIIDRINGQNTNIKTKVGNITTNISPILTDGSNIIQTQNAVIQKKIDETNIKTFYLATDCFYAHEKIINEIPNINIIQNTLPPPNISNLHYSSTDKYKQVYECLRDIYFILKSDHFIPSINSGMSLLIIEMKKSKINFFDSKKLNI